MISTPVVAALNHLLAGENWAREKLAAYAGKVALLDAGLVALRLKVAPDGMLQNARSEEVPSVTITAKWSDLPLILQNRDRAFSYVRIEGDADFANTISQLSQSLQWEAEEDLSKVFGDVAANRIVSATKAVAGTVKTSQQKLAENLAEYFLEEEPTLVRPRAVTDFAEAVARLRDDVERLDKRIEKLEGRR